MKSTRVLAVTLGLLAASVSGCAPTYVPGVLSIGAGPPTLVMAVGETRTVTTAVEATDTMSATIYSVAVDVSVSPGSADRSLSPGVRQLADFEVTCTKAGPHLLRFSVVGTQEDLGYQAFASTSVLVRCTA